MRAIVVIGTSDRSSLWRHGTLEEDGYDQFVTSYAELLSEHFDTVIGTPSDGVYTDVALAFAARTGRKTLAYYPDKDTFYGYEMLKPNFAKFDTRPIGGDWYRLDAEITKQAAVVLCLGFSPGALIELCFLKYHQQYAQRKITLLIDERCIDRRLPEGVHEGIESIHYFSSFDELRALIER